MNQGPLKLERSEGTSIRPTHRCTGSAMSNLPITSRMSADPVIAFAFWLPKVAKKPSCQPTYSCTWPENSTSTSDPREKPSSFLVFLGFWATLLRRNQIAGGSIFLCWMAGGLISVTTAAGAAGPTVAEGGPGGGPGAGSGAAAS